MTSGLPAETIIAERDRLRAEPLEDDERLRPVVDEVNAEISRSLGRDLGACGGRTPCTATATVPLVMPGSMYDHRIRRLDVRVTKQVRLTPRLRMQGNLDIYNVFNSGSAVQINNAFGSQWRQPTEVQDPRILQFSAQLNF